MEPLWRLIETCHAVVYFAQERRHEYERIGLRGGWMGYFASRAGALGPVGPEVVSALFYNFSPAMVARALPDAWRLSTPDAAVEARLRVVDGALTRILADEVAGPAVRRAAELCRTAVEQSPESGRPLFAAHRALPLPDEPHLALFWATTALRELRGDGHNAVLLATGVDGCEAHVLMGALGLVPADQRTFRGWTDDDWEAATERLRQRGWLHRDRPALTDAGREGRAQVERDTERLAAPALGRLGATGAAELAQALTPLVDRIVASRDVPFPNAMGLPPVDQPD